SGTAKQGAAIYAQKCALCHGEKGVNPAPGFVPMVGPSKFDRIDTMKTVPYYKYATTLFDVMRRSMPYPIPKTLTGDELYALSAYILFLNKIVPEDAAMDAKSLPQVKMPNRDNFIRWDPNKIEYDSLPSAAAEPLENGPWSLGPGVPIPPYGQPSKFEQKVVRTLSNPKLEPRGSAARTPHHLLNGTITPNGLHFVIARGGETHVDPD